MDFAKTQLKKPKVPGNSLAWSSTNATLGGITVNAKFGGNLPKFLAVLSQDVKSGWHPVGCQEVKSVVDHELAHQLDNLLELSNDADLTAIYQTEFRPELLSHYAAENIAEFIAEAWAEFRNNPNPRSLAAKVGRLILDRYNRSKSNGG
jgi:hypothetical protein